MRLLLKMSLLIVVIMSLQGCVHQWPEPVEIRKVTIHVTHELDWTYHHITIPAGRSIDPDHHIVRYIINVYRPGSHERIAGDIFFRHILEPEDFDVTLMVPVGDCEIRIWADYVDEGLRVDHLYSADDFDQIKFTEPFCGGMEEKDAFAGMTDLNVPPTTLYDNYVEGNVVMRRPLAAYAFITTDVGKFLESRGSKGAAPADVAARVSALAEYKVKVIYAGFYAHTYNHFDDNPVGASTGVTYDASISALNGDEALLCFDHVMVNGIESSTPVAIEVYDTQGDCVASIHPVTLPVKRSRCTVVRGEFLSTNVGGGLGIDPGFDGQYIVEIF